jgi:hypothetical protein
VEYFRAISEKYRSLTGIRSAPPTRSPAGAFFEYGYYQFGVPSFSTPGWGLPAAGTQGGDRSAIRPPDEPAGAASQVPAETTGTGALDLRLLRWLETEKIECFIPWTPFRHPVLGEVEIGGFLPYITANPQAARLADLGKPHAEFILYLSSLFPRVSVAKTEVTSLGGGLFRIKAEIENSGFLPTATAQGVLARAVKPTMVQLGVDPSDIVSGDAKTSFFQSLAGSGGRQKYEWIVKGKAGATVALKLVSQKGGSETATLTLK